MVLIADDARRCFRLLFCEIDGERDEPRWILVEVCSGVDSCVEVGLTDVDAEQERQIF